MAKSYAQKMQEDWERGQLKKYKRDNGLERKDVLLPQKERVRDYAGRSAGTGGGNGAGVKSKPVGAKGPGASGAGVKSRPTKEAVKASGGSSEARSSGNSGAAWVQNGRVMTWNNNENRASQNSYGYKDNEKRKTRTIDETREALRKAYRQMNKK